MQRRCFLQSMALPALAWTAVGRSAMAASGTADSPVLPGQRRLVVVFLRGAIDGLSVVAPYTESAYHQQRPDLALAPPGQDDGLLDLDGHFGLHPQLAPLMPCWQAGQLAFVHASGSPDPTRSHFDAQDYMESGTPGVKSTPDGWLNRLLGAGLPTAQPTGKRDGTTRALSLGTTLPRVWAGPHPVANLPTGTRALKPTPLDRRPVGTAFDALYAGDDAMSEAYRRSRQSRQELRQAIGSVSMDSEQMAADNGAPPPSGFAADASRLGRLMRRDPQVQLAFAALGGWDTHLHQGAARGQLANRLQQLGHGLAELVKAMGPVFDDSTILLMSEFGRTARQNGTMGTDHGHGNVMWALGGRVAGGKVYGRWPGVDPSALHEGRDLAVTTDFRQVLAGVCASGLGLPDARLAEVFPGFTGTPLHLARNVR